MKGAVKISLVTNLGDYTGKFHKTRSMPYMYPELRGTIRDAIYFKTGCA